MVPVGGFDGGHEIGDAGAILGDHHAHLAGRARVPVGHHPARSFMGAIPEGDPGLRKQIRNRHEGRSDDPEGMFDPMHLKGFHEGFFNGHLHHGGSWG